MGRQVVLLTEIIAPYRIPVFNALARCDGIGLHVIFLAETDPAQRHWLVYKDEIQFSYQVLKSWRKRISGHSILLNLGVWSALDRFHPDVVLCGGYNYLAYWEAAAWARFHKRPVVGWVESTGRDRRRASFPIEFLKSGFLAACEAFAVPGKSSFAYLKSFGVADDRIHMAPNAVDIGRFARLAGEARAKAGENRRHLGLPVRFFLFVGRLVRDKGALQLLEAYARLDAGLRSQVGLVLVGEGEAKCELLGRAAEIKPNGIQFPGHVQRDQLASFYALAEALVFPTLTDPWGLVVNEAMACGLPVIASDVAGCTADLVQHGWNGFVVPSGNVSELARAMETLARQPELGRAMGARSVQRIAAYSPEHCASGLALAARLGNLGP